MYRISLVTGDGIGPELSEAACMVLDAINDRLGLGLEVTRLQAGDAALADTGRALPRTP
jgi:3-isopropylmalate dehydrogenase